jgi:two-component system, NtrC family, sensor kinase
MELFIMASPRRRKATSPDKGESSTSDQTAYRATDTAPQTTPETLQDAKAVLRRATAELRRQNRTLRNRLDKLRTLIHTRPDFQKTYTRQAEWVTAMSTLAAGIAHELNNPLNIILMNTEDAHALYRSPGGSNGHDMEQALQDIAHETKRCASIIKNLLRLVRSAPSEKWPADLNVIVQRTVCHIERTNCPATVILHCVLDPQLPRLMLNPAEIEQLLCELIANAIAATEQNRRIILRTTVSGETVHLKVEDNGLGIPAAQLRHIFDPFYSTWRHLGGMGLGLSFVHGVVTDHQGIIRVHSIPREGTTVDITFLVVAQGEQQRDQGPGGGG